MFRPRARILVYRGTTNLGDAIQSVAMARLLGGTCAGIYRDAPVPDLYRDVPFVVNGWLGGGFPEDGEDCIFAGVHVGDRESEYIQWIQRSSHPVGARDEYTQGLLACNRIKSEMIACATLTLPQYRGPRRGRLSVDVGPVDATEFETSLIPDLPWAEQWDLALHRLDQLRKAEIVYTRRLHVILPCLAFGTPVVFPLREFRDLFDKSRLSLLHDIGFVFDEPVEMDVSPMAERFTRFLERALGEVVQPVELPPVPVPLETSVFKAVGAPRANRAEPVRIAARRDGFKARPRVSAVVMTRDGASRLPMCLSSIQRTDFVEDIIVCVDARTNDESLEIARSFTRDVHLIRGDFIEMAIPRLISLCPGDFVLRIDDDELLGGNWDKESFELLVRFNDITHFWTPRRWIIPPGDQYIASPPWFPDLHLRLFANNPLIISCPTRIHDHLRVEGRSLILYDRWIEHLDLVLTTRSQREAKCQEYLQARPDHDLSHFYLYENQKVEMAPLATSPSVAAEQIFGERNPFRPAVRYQLGSDLLFQSGGNAAGYLLEGWSSPEAWGIWSLGHHASICLPMENPIGRGATLSVEVQPFIEPQHPVSRVQVLYFGEQIDDWTFDSPVSVEKRITLPPHLVLNDLSPVFAFRVLNPASPFELGLSSDPRHLGLGFIRLRLTPD